MNGDEIKIKHGDKIITLEEQLAGMSRSIRWLQITSIILVVLVILSALLTDESMNLLINGVLGLFGD